jgi:hypothetical protein
MSTVAESSSLDHVIRDAAELTAFIERCQRARWQVLSPATKVTALADSYGVLVSTVLINPDPGRGEVYFDRQVMQGDELALTRIGLQRIEQVAGLSWLPWSRRTDPRMIQNLWEYESWGSYLSFDGTPRTVKGTAEVDLREGSAQIGEWTREAWEALVKSGVSKDDWKIGGWSKERLIQARRFGLRLAETKSQSACVRNAFGVRQKYTRAELLQPFVVLRVMYLPDERDPEIRQLLAANRLQGVSALFAHTLAGMLPTRMALPEASLVDTIDVTPREREPLPRVETVPDVQDSHVSNRQQLRTSADTFTPSSGRANPLTSGSSTASPPEPSAPPPSPPAHTQAHQGGKTAAVVDALQRRGVKSTPKPPLPEGACTVEAYREDAPKAKRDGSGTFVKAYITTSDGRELTCVYGKWRERLKAAKDTRTPLLIRDKTSEYGSAREVAAIEDVGAPQDRPLPMDPPDEEMPF